MPLSPPMPTLVNLDSKVFTFFWEEPYSHPLAPITHYVIEYRTSQRPLIINQVTTLGIFNTYTLSGLGEETNIFVRVLAASSVGEGAPSEWLEVVTLKS